jgi:hypothetical protein
MERKIKKVSTMRQDIPQMTTKYSYLTSDQSPRPVLAHVKDGGTLKALVSFRGNIHRHFYEVVNFEMGKMPIVCFRSMEDAVAFAQCA